MVPASMRTKVRVFFVALAVAGLGGLASASYSPAEDVPDCDYMKCDGTVACEWSSNHNCQGSPDGHTCTTTFCY